MISLYIKPKIKRHITSKEFEGTLYLLDPHKGHLHTLNDTAKIIWVDLQKHKTVGEIINTVTNQFNVSYSIAKKDALEFIRRMIRLQVVDINVLDLQSIKKRHKHASSSQKTKGNKKR